MSAHLARGLAQAATDTGPHRVVWLEFQDCAGCTESFLRGQDPDVATLVLGMISLDYQETLMAAAGHQAEQARRAAIAEPGYLLIVEGSIPDGDMPGACTIGGRSASDLLAESAHNAAAIVAVGTCASFGGIRSRQSEPHRGGACAEPGQRGAADQRFRLPPERRQYRRDHCALGVVWRAAGRG